MALDYKILEQKATTTIKDKSGNYQQCLDLLTATFIDDDNGEFNPLIVNKYYVARPDLISFAVYGTDKYADYICKFNGISNPFELNEDDIILIPTLDYLNNMNAKQQNYPCELITEENNPIMEKKKQTQKLKTERRSPNEQTLGDENFVIDKSLGIVFY